MLFLERLRMGFVRIPSLFNRPEAYSYLSVLRNCMAMPKSLTTVISVPEEKVETFQKFNNPNVYNVLKMLKPLGIKYELVHKALEASPELLQYSPSSWKECVSALVDVDVPKKQAIQMITVCPRLLSLSENQIKEVWSWWTKEINENDRVVSLISDCPTFLFSSEKDIAEKFAQLKAIVGGIKFSCDVLRNCPQIMHQGISQLEDVGDYLSVTMKVRKAHEIYKSTVLGYTLRGVMERHLFLDRCGKYKPPNPKHAESVPTGNASLEEIFDTSPEEFATKVAGLTLEEFVVFQSVLEKEIEQSFEDEDDDDSDED